MHICKQNGGKFIFNAILFANGLHYATVASRWAREFTNEVGALEGTTVSLNAIYCKSAAFCLEHVFVQKKERDIPSNSFFIMKNTIY